VERGLDPIMEKDRRMNEKESGEINRKERVRMKNNRLVMSDGTRNFRLSNSCNGMGDELSEDKLRSVQKRMSEMNKLGQNKRRMVIVRREQ